MVFHRERSSGEVLHLRSIGVLGNGAFAGLPWAATDCDVAERRLVSVFGVGGGRDGRRRGAARRGEARGEERRGEERRGEERRGEERRGEARRGGGWDGGRVGELGAVCGGEKRGKGKRGREVPKLVGAVLAPGTLWMCACGILRSVCHVSRNSSAFCRAVSIGGAWSEEYRRLATRLVAVAEEGRRGVTGRSDEAAGRAFPAPSVQHSVMCAVDFGTQGTGHREQHPVSQPQERRRPRHHHTD